MYTIIYIDAQVFKTLLKKCIIYNVFATLCMGNDVNFTRNSFFNHKARLSR